MCILLWTLPNCSHPRFKFAFASNRDEFLARETSRADFWDLQSILERTSYPDDADHNDTKPTTITVGVLSGQDLQRSVATDYIIQETETTPKGEEKVTLTLSTKDVPGTWLGMTTQGDLVALTNYRETQEYLSQLRAPKLSRGKVCGEYLINMATAHERSGVSDPSQRNVAPSRAEQWLRKRAIGWEDEFEGLNLLVVQNCGEQQCIGGNREGSGMSVYRTNTKQSEKNVNEAENCSRTIAPGTVVGVSNSVFTRPWIKVEMGVRALEKTLSESLDLFGTESHATLPTFNSPELPALSPTPPSKGDITEQDTIELAWLVVEMLTLLRIHTKPFPEGKQTVFDRVMGLRERVFIPRFDMGSSKAEYGTRSSTVVLFGRENRLGVYVEKIWYGPLDTKTGELQEFAPDSPDGLIWWQGLVGEPRDLWRKIEGEELATLLLKAQIANKLRQA
ncbi:MAG: hypothetical protein J3Q66DRAFT_382749 [Benniella sp.]|nr:MAG: hypothetical protein J3Q66DRAFT_382749 [Benniella sp.]